VTALLRYAVEANVDDQVWPVELLTDDAGYERSWHHFLVESVAAALPRSRTAPDSWKRTKRRRYQPNMLAGRRCFTH